MTDSQTGSSYGFGVETLSRLRRRTWALFGVGLVLLALAVLSTGGTFVGVLLGLPLDSSVPPVPMSTVFGASFLLVAPFWMLMLLVPTWDVTERVMTSRLPVVPAALLYLVLLIPVAPRVASTVIDPSLSGMTTMLSTEFGATIAWVHFLAFDLFVGRWMYRDARRRGVAALVLAPNLLLTLLFGPVGFVCYTGVRSATTEA